MFDVGWTELVVLVLASYRLTHVLVFDAVAEPFRRWLGVTSAGAATAHGQAYAAPYGPGSRSGARSLKAAAAQVAACYWCAGVWVSAALVAVYLAWPSAPVKGILLALAVAGGQAMLESVTQR